MIRPNFLVSLVATVQVPLWGWRAEPLLQPSRQSRAGVALPISAQLGASISRHSPSGERPAITMEILVADSTGKCIRSVLKSSTFVGTDVEFSYPVNGTTNRGRIT